MLGRPGLDNEVGFIKCACALGFSFIATTHTFVPSRLPSHVFILLSLLRAHLHICPSLNFCLPLGRRVCVCAPCSHRDPVGLFFPFQQGRVALSSYHTQRSCGREWEGKLGQFPVPAVIITPISGPCSYLKQEIRPLHRFALGSHA